MRGDEDAATRRGVLHEPVGKDRLAFGIEAAGRFVEDEQVGLGHGHRGDPEPLALSTREVTRMAPGQAVEADACELDGGPLGIAGHGERDLVEHCLAHEVAARILEEVAGAAGARHRPGLGLEEPRSELRKRRLPGAVRALEGDDLPAGHGQVGAVEHRHARSVGVRHPAKLNGLRGLALARHQPARWSGLAGHGVRTATGGLEARSRLRRRGASRRSRPAST